MPFTMQQKVKFKHCDPAGIVFYPRYFEMINDCIESFFDEALGVPFEELHREDAVPTAEISVKFSAPSRHGDRLRLSLQCTRLGRSSLGIETLATCNGERRFTATQTLVLVDANGKPQPWPDDLRTQISAQMQDLAA